MSADAASLTLGARIRTLRRARGLTQDRLAQSTGVSRSAVAQWESDRAGYSSGMLGRIAEVLGVSVAMLRDGWDGIASDSILSSDEMTLLRLFRDCDGEDRAVILQLAQRIAASSSRR
jgi:transcriptional regulator with XRE-family HTH domain